MKSDEKPIPIRVIIISGIAAGFLITAIIMGAKLDFKKDDVLADRYDFILEISYVFGYMADIIDQDLYENAFYKRRKLEEIRNDFENIQIVENYKGEGVELKWVVINICDEFILFFKAVEKEDWKNAELHRIRGITEMEQLDTILTELREELKNYE